MRIKQMEGRYSPLAYAQIVAVGLSVMAVLTPTFISAAASYRPERNPQITQALNDLGWLPIIMNWPPPAIQTLAVGFAIFTYKGDRPVWPRWVGYYNLWTAFILMFGGLVVLFRTGVLAWDGVLAFWVAATAFGLWFLVMTWQLLVIIDKPKADSGGDVEEFAPRQT